jgi:hypothetical protein
LPETSNHNDKSIPVRFAHAFGSKQVAMRPMPDIASR